MSTIRYLIQVSVNQASNIRWSIHVKTFSSWDCQADLTMQIIKSSQSFLDKFLIDKNLVSFLVITETYLWVVWVDHKILDIDKFKLFDHVLLISTS